MHPVRYRFVVDGELGPRYEIAFPGMTLTTCDGSTEIAGMVLDQAQLQGIVDRIGELGLSVVSITRNQDQRTV